MVFYLPICLSAYLLMLNIYATFYATSYTNLTSG